jgi:DNA-binding GntR family transcriptional regulator
LNADLLSATAATSFRVDRLPSTFRQHIAERLRSAILAGDIAPGAQLVESTLAAQFNVSQGPLRKALRQLVEEGLLVTVPYTGACIHSRWTMSRDLFDADARAVRLRASLGQARRLQARAARL